MSGENESGNVQPTFEQRSKRSRVNNDEGEEVSDDEDSEVEMSEEENSDEGEEVSDDEDSEVEMSEGEEVSDDEDSEVEMSEGENSEADEAKAAAGVEAYFQGYHCGLEGQTLADCFEDMKSFDTTDEAAHFAMGFEFGKSESIAVETDKYAKHRAEIEALIQEPEAREWSDFLGQEHAVQLVKPTVAAINKKVCNQLGLLFEGPPASGKTTLAEIMASKINGTLFFAGKTFAHGKPHLWQVLMGIAKEKAPSIILIDECEGALSERHRAAVPALCEVWKDGSMVLIVGTTNAPLALPPKIRSRFGPPIHFARPPPEVYQNIVKQCVQEGGALLHMLPPDWETLLNDTTGMDTRELKSLARRVTEQKRFPDGVEVVGGPPTIVLADFQAVIALQSTNAPATADGKVTIKGDAKDEVVKWIKENFEYKICEYGRASVTQERIVFVYDLVLCAAEDKVENWLLRQLGAKDISKLIPVPDPMIQDGGDGRVLAEKEKEHKQAMTRAARSLRKEEATLYENLKHCFQEVLPLCKWEDKTGEATWRVRLTRDKEEKMRHKGLIVRHLRFKTPPPEVATLHMARKLKRGAFDDPWTQQIAHTLQSHPQWNAWVVESLLRDGARPILLSVEKVDSADRETSTITLSCTFAQGIPQEEEKKVSGVKVTYDNLKLWYPDMRAKWHHLVRD